MPTEAVIGAGDGVSINILFAYCKGGSFNIYIGRCSAISTAKQGKSGSIY